VVSKAPSPNCLHDATERLNSALLEAEDALCDLELGVTASISLDDGRVLHFQKKGNEWGFYVGRDGDESSETKLLSASRKTRIEVAQKLPALRAALLAAYQAQLECVEGSIGHVQAFTASLQVFRRRECDGPSYAPASDRP